MALKEMQEYLATHPKYSLATNDKSPYTKNMRVLKHHFIVDGKSYSNYVKFPVYVSHSEAYIKDTNELHTNALNVGDHKLIKYLETYNKIKQ